MLEKDCLLVKFMQIGRGQKVLDCVSRVSSSYVALNLVENRTPQFGQITRIFSHTFARCDTIFVEISLFDTPMLDNDTSMWTVPLPSRTTTITSVQDISQPLVIAREEDENALWFLNYH